MIDLEQGSTEWFQERLGKVTASRVHAVYVGKKGAASYGEELIQERLSGRLAKSFTSAAMQWGTATEEQARRSYTRQTKRAVRTVGFVAHPTMQWAGASPDGFVGIDGLLEIKCPSTKVHFDTLSRRTMPTKYYSQVQWQMACTERHWVDFVSFDPRVPERNRLFLERVHRDTNYIEILNERVERFLDQVERRYRRMVCTENLAPTKPVAKPKPLSNLTRPIGIESSVASIPPIQATRTQFEGAKPNLKALHLPANLIQIDSASISFRSLAARCMYWLHSKHI